MTDHGVILVVDDDLVNRMTLACQLEADGHEVRQAENGRAALEAVRSQPPDVVLLDLVMPELDGFGVLAALKADASLHELPVIMISATEELDRVVACSGAAMESRNVKQEIQVA